MRKEVNFSITTHWISNLGDTRTKTFILFDLATVSFSTSSFLFTNKIQSFLPNSFQTDVSTVLFYTFSLLLIFLLFFPVNKNYKVHRVISNLVFISILGALVSFFQPLYKADDIPTQALFLLALTIIVGFVFLISFIKLQIRYKEIPKTLENVRKKEKSLLIKNVCLLEWMFFFLVFCFQLFAVYL